jgi:uncharacterized membrane protein YbhN (UPF0104 family)
MPARTPPRWQHVGWTLSGILLAAVFLYYALRGVDVHELGQTLAAARPGLVVLTCLLSTVTLLVRAVRWQVLLNSEGHVGFDTVFWATAAGYFGNNFLPARAGELVRTLLVTWSSPLDGAYVLATALAERVTDAIVLVLIASVVLMLFPGHSGWLAGAARPFAVAGVCGALVVAILPLTGTLPHRMVCAIPMPVSLQPRAVRAVDAAIRGLRAFHSLSRLAWFVALTGFIWTVDALTAVVAATGIGLHLPLPIAFLLLSALGVASALPSTPGYVGIFQFVSVMVLTPFGFRRAEAISLVVVLQASSYAVNAVWGSIGLARYRRAAKTHPNS